MIFVCLLKLPQYFFQLTLPLLVMVFNIKQLISCNVATEPPSDLENYRKGKSHLIFHSLDYPLTLASFNLWFNFPHTQFCTQSLAQLLTIFITHSMFCWLNNLFNLPPTQFSMHSISNSLNYPLNLFICTLLLWKRRSIWAIATLKARMTSA